MSARKVVLDMDSVLLEQLEALAIEAAVAAGRLIVGERPDMVAVAATKTSPTDVVTAMDTAAEDFLREVLRRERPHDALLGEERAISAGESGLTWVLDPIDGTVNYLYGIPQFGVSVAVVTGDPTTVGAWRPVAGAVAHPSVSTVYHARAGAGAWRRGPDGRDERLTVSTASSLDAALVGTGFGYRADQRRAQAEILARVLPRVRDIRRMGSAALDLCLVASGRLDVFYEMGLNAWDIAAAWLVVTEAGGVLRGADGGPPAPGLTLAGPVGLVEELDRLVRAEMT